MLTLGLLNVRDSRALGLVEGGEHGLVSGTGENALGCAHDGVHIPKHCQHCYEVEGLQG